MKSRTLEAKDGLEALNGLCPYYTMFPLDFPMGVLRTADSTPGWVLDPFCGRGTTTYAARLRGIPTLGIDSNPVAVAIAAAKLVDVSPGGILDEANEILRGFRVDPETPTGAFWRNAYAPGTLRQICILRQALLERCDTPSQIALRGVVLGALHGPQGKTKSSYLSNQCPRTFAPKPDYAVSFWRDRDLRARPVDVLAVIAERAIRYYSNRPPAVTGSVVLGDSRSPDVFGKKRRFRWVITSPPFYGLRTYVQDQWLRHWFLGGGASPSYQVNGQLDHASPDEFADQLRAVWQNAAEVSLPGARLVCRFGQISDRPVDPVELIAVSLIGSGWILRTRKSAGTARDGRRQATQFGSSNGPPKLEYDFYASLSGD